jgi:hypothetical protein
LAIRIKTQQTEFKDIFVASPAKLSRNTNVYIQRNASVCCFPGGNKVRSTANSRGWLPSGLPPVMGVRLSASVRLMPSIFSLDFPEKTGPYRLAGWYDSAVDVEGGVTAQLEDIDAGNPVSFAVNTAD